MTTTDLALSIPSSSPLARLETARRLLAEVRGVDDAKAIHDFAEAARVYARQARLGQVVDRFRVVHAADFGE